MKKLFLTFLIVIYFFEAFSQQTSTTIPSSDISSYGNISVGNHTGGFNYSLPLFSLSEKDVNTGVSLNYSSNGVVLDKPVSEVGVDWYLNAGGIITRTVKDLPDTAFEKISFNGHGVLSNRWYEQDIDIEDDQSNIKNSSYHGNYKDTEPDWFTFHVNGISGDFFFDENLNIQMGGDESLVITYNEEDSVFEILDSKGFKYFFGEEENGEKIARKVFYHSAFSADYMIYTDSWFLTRIVSPTGNTINFNYIPSNNYDNNFSIYYSTSIENTCDSNSPNEFEEGELERDIYNTTVFTPYWLKEITSSDSKIEFVYTGFDEENNYNVLDEITLSTNDEVVGRYIFNYELVTSMAPHSDPLVSSNTSVERLRKRYYLSSINKVLPMSDLVSERYAFEYYNKEALPCLLSYNRDKYGYYNGADNSLKPFAYPDDNAIKNLLISTVDSTTLNYFGADHSVNPETVYYGMLSKITYPTGGYTEIEYEANSDEEDGNIIYGPGARVFSIVDSNGAQEYRREYFYNSIEHYPSNETSLKFSYENNNWYKYTYEQRECSPIPDFDFTKYVFTNNSLLSQFNRDIGPYYTAVTEFKIQDGEIANAVESKYKDVVNNPPTSLHGGEVIFGVPNSNNSKAFYGLLYEKNFYKKTGNQFDLVKRNTFNYDILDTQYYYANVFLEHYELTQGDDSDLPNINISRYANYNFVTRLVSKATELYDPNSHLIGESVTTFNYSGAPYYQLQSTESQNSHGEDIIKTYRYPNNITNPSPAEQELVNQHRISTPIETKSYLDNDLLYTKYIKYKDWGTNAWTDHLVLPEQIMGAKANALLEPKTVYHKYDTYGNLIETSKAEGAHRVAIWGYNHTQPIAKIENTTYADIEALPGFGNDFEIPTYFSASQENQLRSLLPNAMVTTYEYIPLVGVKTITQPNGEKVHYEYDNFNRLKYVKNSEGKILKENEYHYNYSPYQNLSGGSIIKINENNEYIEYMIDMSSISGGDGNYSFNWTSENGTINGNNTSQNVKVYYSCGSLNNNNLEIQCTIRDTDPSFFPLIIQRNDKPSFCVFNGSISMEHNDTDGDDYPDEVTFTSNITGGLGTGYSYHWVFQSEDQTGTTIVSPTNDTNEYTISYDCSLLQEQIHVSCIITDANNEIIQLSKYDNQSCPFITGDLTVTTSPNDVTFTINPFFPYNTDPAPGDYTCFFDAEQINDGANNGITNQYIDPDNPNEYIVEYTCDADGEGGQTQTLSNISLKVKCSIKCNITGTIMEVGLPEDLYWIIFNHIPNTCSQL